VVPPPGFLAGLRELADERGLVLIFDEVYTGFGRTGRWFACEHAGVVPDVLVVGKALTGMVPLSAAIGTPEVMSAWPPSTGEAVHTSTFLGNPAACAAALAQLAEIEERGLVHRAATLGSWLRERLDAWADRFPSVGEVRGLGLLQGVELVEDRATRRPATALARRVADAALREGVLLLTEGPAANVLAFTPPLVITEAQLEHALGVVEAALAAARA
jgi:4-aminobutyrate aminotransferase/(S)-3-amino-2-methylpropionate transaminase